MSLSSRRRRVLAIVATGCLALGSAAGLVGGLVSCAGREGPVDISRPLSTAEAGRLASMRLNNYTDARAGLRGTLGRGAEQVRLSGWIDWRRPLVYLSVAGKVPGPSDGLVQAVPAAVAVRPDRLASGATTPPATGASPEPTGPEPGVVSASAKAPPLPPPVDGWRVRPFGGTGPSRSPLDTTLQLLFTIAATQADAPDLLAASDARWLRGDQVDGVPVDVLLGPLVPPRPATASAAPSGTAGPSGTAAPSVLAPSLGAVRAQGGPVRYWVDAGGRLRRLEATVGASSPLVLDIERGDQREIATTELLGGRTVTPRRVTAPEAATLARLRQRDRATGGGPVTIQVPAPGLNLLTATGWVDWRNRVAYVAVRDTARPSGQVLLRADPTGESTLDSADRTPDGRPPLPVPRGDWQRMSWTERADAAGATDLDLLLNETIALANPNRDDPDALARTAAWLRTDTVQDVPVTVYEILTRDELGHPMGSGRVRYWVDGGGVLRRLEVRSQVGGFGRLDLDPGSRVPVIGSARTG